MLVQSVFQLKQMISKALMTAFTVQNYRRLLDEDVVMFTNDDLDLK